MLKCDMKKFSSKIIVKVKPTSCDSRCSMLKDAIDKFMDVPNLTCLVGTYYLLTFDANNEVEALNTVEKIAKELLTNDNNEVYEIKSLQEVYEEIE